MIHLSGPLQVPKVNVGYEENGLGLQVAHGLEVSGVGLLGNAYHAYASVFTWTPGRQNRKIFFSEEETCKL